MSKTRTSYQCTNCSYHSIKWMGCCPECNQWETFKSTTQTTSNTLGSKHKKPATLVNLKSFDMQHNKRMLSGISEWDRVIGDGIVPGSFLILTGDPGIGKSTLLLQISDKLSRNYKVFYFSSEESLQQVKNRSKRLGCVNGSVLFSDQSNIEEIITSAEQEKPDIIIIDSIQNCYTNHSQVLPGSIGQLRESGFLLMRMAKENNIATIVSGHINKEGNIAGPKTLEHIVDGVFYLQGEDRWQTRVLRAVKNRFGTINELGFFHMDQNGLQEVPNINQHLINEISNAPGSSLISFIEGSRPLLIELQALTIKSKLGIPQRVISGIDHKQVILIAAILEKYLQIQLSIHDIFFKVSGGFKIRGSSADLGIALSLLSSYFQQPILQKSISLGEISLTGQIKPINQINIFIKEAEKFGIEKLLVAKNQKTEKTNCEIKRFGNVYELLTIFEG